MALQLWMPLMGDLRNQGLSNFDITTLGTISWVNGKLGAKALQAGNASQTTNGVSINSNLTDLLSEEYSISVWVKPLGNHVHYNGTILSSGDWNHTRWAFGVNQDNTKVDMLSNGHNIYVNCTIPVNEWTHLVCTCNSSNQIYLYKNGEYITYITRSDKPQSDATNTTIGRETYAGGYFSFNGVIQDLRLYDHCLSPMEVKELAKGLILHYPLNRQGWGQENLMRNTYSADGNNSNQVYGWMANGNGNPEIVTKDGNKCIHLQASCTGAYTPSIVSASKLLLENGVDYIVSCDLMYDKEIKVQNTTPVHYHNGSTSSTDPFNLTNVNNGKGFVWKSVKPVANTIIPANTWQHYEMRLTAVATPTDSSLPYSTYRAFIYGAVRTTSETATVNMWLKNWKIEKGTVATPWCPNSSDELATTMGLNSTIEYDCSGFCNNGEKIGTLTYTSDTPKYAVSTHLDATTTKIHISNFPTSGFSNSYTFAWWAKISSVTPMHWGFSDGIRLNGMYTGRLWNTGDGSNNPLYNIGTTTQVTAPTVNVWHHWVMTGNGTKCYVYQDGELWAEAKTYKSISGTSIYINGWANSTDYSSNNYSISDFRIYATALSASDVKSLYQNCATIDPDGTIRGQIRS